MMPPFNLKNWIEENRHLLKPPVGNKVIWENSEFIVMLVGGPNSRTDFHIDESEEFFHQIEGNFVLKLYENGEIRDVAINAGDVFLLPAKVPHSPQRPAGSVGMVIERKRTANEKDGFAWFCPKCGTKLYEEYLHVSNIMTQMPPVFRRFYDSAENCTCKKCGTQVVEKKIS